MKINSDSREDRRKLNQVKGTIRALEALGETAALAVLYYLMFKIAYRTELFPPYYGRGKLVLMLVYIILVIVLFYMCEGFKFGYLKLADVVLSQSIAVIIIDVISYLQLSLIANVMVSFWPILLLIGLDILVCFVLCWCFTALYHAFYVPQDMLMIAGTRNAIDLKFKMDTRRDKYHISKILPENADNEELVREIAEHDAVIINDVSAEVRNNILKYCYQNQVRTYVVPKISDIIVRGSLDVTLFDTPLLLVKGYGLTTMQAFWKRFFDILISCLAMVIAGPIMLVVAIAIKLDDHGPVFYTQDRVTKDGRVFKIYKFRSMVVNAESYGSFTGATEDDPRITKVGRVIRATRLDEIPQIFNIIKGDMSIVGPRPEHTQNNDKYTAEIPEFADRLKVKGGLTGYAQIYGKYNTSAYDKLRLDLIYIENYSLLLDFKLCLMTLRIMFTKESTEGFDKAEELEEMKEEEIRKDGLTDDFRSIVSGGEEGEKEKESGKL